MEGFCECGEDPLIFVKCWEFSNEDQIASYEGFCSVDLVCYTVTCFVFGTRAPQWARASSFTRFIDHTQRRTTVGRTPLDE